AICGGAGGACIHRAAERAAPGNAGERQRRERPPDDVDEEGSATVGAGKIAFQSLDMEGELVALELRILEDHDSVLDRTILAQHGDGRVRRIFGETVVTRSPLRDHVSGRLVACGPYWTVGKYDEAGRYAGQSECVALQRSAAGVEHEERRHDLGLG